MSSLLNTTAEVHHVTPFPAGTTKEEATTLLQGKGNEIIIQCDPHMVRYEVIETPSPTPVISPDHKATGKGIAPPRCYKVVDRVAALPAGLWDSDLESTCEFIDMERGVFVRLRSPMGVVMETVWQVREATKEGGGGEGCEYELVEDILIKASRLLVGTVKGTCEDGWRQVHQKMMERLQEQKQ